MGNGEKKTVRVLIVDDDVSLRRVLEYNLQEEGYEVLTAGSGEEGLRLFDERGPALVVTDLKMPGMGGFQLLREVKERSPDTVVIVITAFGAVEAAVEAMKAGAYDFITKPFNREALKLTVRKALDMQGLSRENRRLKEELSEREEFRSIIGISRPMEEVFRVIDRVADTDATVLITGESGTGKELVARAIHGQSSRRTAPFVAINCAAIPRDLLESELFGHVKGAFTNALMDKRGLFEEADGGTCFLDEIGDMPISLQVKLLRVLQTSEIRRIGGTTSTFVNVRFVAATNKHLPSMVKSKEFREDLFYRLHVITINLPPLRDHLDDIPLLAEHFFRKAVAKSKKDVRCISQEAMDVLASYNWPGNIRQLENTIERAIALTSNKALLVSDIPSEVLKKADSPAGPEFPTLAKVKLEYIDEVLRHTNGNQKQAAEILGIDRKTLYRLLKNR
ncbi:Regulatory protein AtoC [uncultured bacterium]|nr:Regulatory protein AtoC [uncultured bacterium]